MGKLIDLSKKSNKGVTAETIEKKLRKYINENEET